VGQTDPCCDAEPGFGRHPGTDNHGNLTSGRAFCTQLSYLIARAVDVRLGHTRAARQSGSAANQAVKLETVSDTNEKGSQVQKLTHRQEMVLQYIQSSITERGYPPTLREIGNFMGIRSTNGVNDHLRALERKGYLTREDMKSRALRPTVFDVKSSNPNGAGYAGVPGGAGVHGVNGVNGLGDAGFANGNGLGVAPGRNGMNGHGVSAQDDSFVEIPILGRVAAGQLTEAIQSPEDTVRIDRMLLGGVTMDVFGLRVRGESMVNAGIRDGDYVFVRKQLDARRGEIIVALVGEEATCKYYYPEQDRIRLVPANERMTDIVINRDDWRSTQILGVVVGLYRKLN
jgi:repressor LexA